MKKIIRYSLLAILFLGFAIACKNKKEDKERTKPDMPVECYAWPDSLDLVYEIADSLRTPEQEELFRSLQKIRYDYTKVENNILVFKMSREDFLKTGIPEPYYELLVSRTKEYNQFIYKWGNMGDTVDRVWERKREAFRKDQLEKEGNP